MLKFFNKTFKIKVQYFVLPVILLIILLLLFERHLFRKEISPILNKNIASSTLTDSLIVDQLIQRSTDFFQETGSRAEPMDGFFKEALDIAERRNLIAQEAIIYNTIGKRFRNRAQYGEALRNHHKALNLAQSINNTKLLADIYNQIGVVYRRTDDNAMGLDMHFKALRLSEEVQDTFNISVAINSIGNVNFNLGRYHSAIEYFLKSLEFSEIMDNTLGRAINTNNIGESLLKLGQPDSALTYYFRSLEYNSQIGSRAGQSICFTSIGSAYIAKKDFSRALEYIDRSLQINRKLGDLMQVTASLAKIGEAHLLMNNFTKAQPALEESFKIAVEIGSRFHAEESARLLSAFHEQTHDHSKALNYYKVASLYKDSILNEKNMYHLTTMEAMLDVETQRDKISQLNRETIKQQSILSRQRLVLTFLIILLTVTLIIAVLLVLQHRLRNKYRNLKHQQKLLRSQMNPHFIFNALSAIQVYVLEHDVEKSTKFLTDFAKLMRLVLKISHYDYISLKDEAEILKYYLDMQKLRFMIPFQYKIHIDEGIEIETMVVPPMITQPFVENAVEHGMKHLNADGHLDVRFKKINNQMIVEVEDNGIGIDASMQQKSEKGKNHESMAIKITKERLDVIRNDSGGKVGLEIIDKKSINPFDRGTLIRIILPLVNFNPQNTSNNGKD
jgi:sensor histidine kinase YesM